MRRYIVIATIVSLVILFSACSTQSKDNTFDTGSLEVSIYKASEQSNDVSMKAKEYFLDTKTESIPFIISNHSDKEYTYGIEPILEIESGGEWYLIPPGEDAVWNDIGYILQANSECEDVLDIAHFYGKLGEGHYRVVKRLFSDEDIFTIAEFDITDQPAAFTGALEAEEGYVEEIYGVDDKEVILKILTSYPENWTPQDAVQDGCFVIANGIVEGDSLAVWETFYTEVGKGNDAAITIAQYSVEGDALPNYISYKNGSFYSVTDFSRDNFSAETITYHDGSYRFLKQFDASETIFAILSDFDYDSIEEFENDTDSNREKAARLFYMYKY